jgi:hypothetical protein
VKNHNFVRENSIEVMIRVSRLSFNRSRFKEVRMKQLKLLAGAVLLSLAVACGGVPNEVTSTDLEDASSPDLEVTVPLMDVADDALFAEAGDGDVGGRWYAVASPINNALVSNTTKIKVEFRADMKKATVQNAFRVSAKYVKNGKTITQSISGRFAWSAGDTKLSFTPSNMPGKANVTWRIGNGAKTEILEAIPALKTQKYRTK